MYLLWREKKRAPTVCSVGIHSGEWHLSKQMCKILACGFDKTQFNVSHYSCCLLKNRGTKCPKAEHCFVKSD